MTKDLYAAYYANHVINETMPFWDARCIDRVCGGYFTCFDRTGRLTDDKKYAWFQGRQLYTYALLYNRIEKRETWLEYAEHGFRFLVDKVYAGRGRWNYRLTRRGEVLIGTTSIFADFHIIQGLAEYMTALKGNHPEGMPLLRESYDAMEQNMFDPGFKDIYENTWSEVFIWHDMYLTCLSAVLPCVPVLGGERTRRLLDECIDKVSGWFARDEYRLVFEVVTRDNHVDMSTRQGRFVNPGHTMESAWFLMEAARIRGDQALNKRGLTLCDWAHQAGYDNSRGGLFSYLDAGGIEPEAIDWFKETNSLWDDKVWWANAEALCAYAYAYENTKDEEDMRRFARQHEYCKDRFYDPEYGEWYERLHRDGSVKVSDKGTEWKCAFHLVRALVFILDSIKRW
jgi:N-acylglucosamine 2-epimerase